MLMLWCLLKDLTDCEVLILWEGPAMDRAMQKLLPMCKHGFDKQENDVAAQNQVRALLSRLRTEGLHHLWTAKSAPKPSRFRSERDVLSCDPALLCSPALTSSSCTIAIAAPCSSPQPCS